MHIHVHTHTHAHTRGEGQRENNYSSSTTFMNVSDCFKQANLNIIKNKNSGVGCGVTHLIPVLGRQKPADLRPVDLYSQSHASQGNIKRLCLKIHF